MLPSPPRFARVVGDEDGGRLEVHWYSLEGAEEYEFLGLDPKPHLLYTGMDTSVRVAERFPKYILLAHAPSDIKESDTLEVEPLKGRFELYSFGSGFHSAACVNPGDSTEPLFKCDPEDEGYRNNLIFVLDSIYFISPSERGDLFGSARSLFARSGSSSAPKPPEGYSTRYGVRQGDTVAVWLDGGIEGRLDESDNFALVVIDSVYGGDWSRDSVRVWVEIRYQRVARLRWF